MNYAIAKILCKSQGEYDENSTYDVLDFVQKGPCLYQSKKPGNKGHDVTDTEWWHLHYDLGAAIAAATDINAQEREDASVVKRLMAIDEKGQPCSIKPLEIVKYVIEKLLDYDLVAINAKEE